MFQQVTTGKENASDADDPQLLLFHHVIRFKFKKTNKIKEGHQCRAPEQQSKDGGKKRELIGIFLKRFHLEMTSIIKEREKKRKVKKVVGCINEAITMSVREPFAMTSLRFMAGPV